MYTRKICLQQMTTTQTMMHKGTSEDGLIIHKVHDTTGTRTSRAWMPGSVPGSGGAVKAGVLELGAGPAWQHVSRLAVAPS
jgi:hypothetical protein